MWDRTEIIKKQKCEISNTYDIACISETHFQCKIALISISNYLHT